MFSFLISLSNIIIQGSQVSDVIQGDSQSAQVTAFIALHDTK